MASNTHTTSHRGHSLPPVGCTHPETVYPPAVADRIIAAHKTFTPNQQAHLQEIIDIWGHWRAAKAIDRLIETGRERTPTAIENLCRTYANQPGCGNCQRGWIETVNINLNGDAELTMKRCTC